MQVSHLPPLVTFPNIVEISLRFFYGDDGIVIRVLV
jgi:hypothetical protein